jgi:hypothetical protein
MNATTLESGWYAVLQHSETGEVSRTPIVNWGRHEVLKPYDSMFAISSPFPFDSMNLIVQSLPEYFDEDGRSIWPFWDCVGVFSDTYAPENAKVAGSQ